MQINQEDQGIEKPLSRAEIGLRWIEIARMVEQALARQEANEAQDTQMKAAA